MNIKVKITTNENMKYYNCPKDTIKEIDLEDYVAIVVASEMGNAPDEALKAQAVASRSFACARGVLDGKVISDSASKAQAFRATRCTYKRAINATKATGGQILTYGGRCASTYFCHSNGGRTYSSEEVWGGKRNYLVSRKDPWTTEKKNGHGVGMSQVGAIAAANQGIKYRDILSFYYPYTSVKTVDTWIYNDTDYLKLVSQAEVEVSLIVDQIREAL